MKENRVEIAAFTTRKFSAHIIINRLTDPFFKFTNASYFKQLAHEIKQMELSKNANFDRFKI